MRCSVSQTVGSCEEEIGVRVIGGYFINCPTCTSS